MTLSLLKKNKFIECPNFLDPEEAKLASTLFQRYCHSMGCKGDSQVPLSKSVYNYPLFLEILYDKVHLLNALLGIKLFPTYTYGRIYEHGAVLEPHRDRAACEISVTLNLSKDLEWPIHFGNPGEKVSSFDTNPGQAVIYLGQEITHWRDSFKGQQHVQAFFHYVNSRGPNANLCNDF